jgi:hypothetical protein
LPWPWYACSFLSRGNITDNVKNFAHQLDTYERDNSFDDWESPSLWEYLGGPTTTENEILDVGKHLSNSSYWNMRLGQRIDYASEYILRYRLLDVLSGLMGIEKLDSCRPVPRVPMIDLSARMERVQSSLSDWTECIAKFDTLLKHHNQNTLSKAEPSPLECVSTVQGHIVWKGLLNLVSAQKHFVEAKFNKALLNIELVAFGLSWFAMVRPYFSFWQT